MRHQKSFILKPAEAKKKWLHVDATGQIVGRLATQIASILRGKGKVTFTPHTDSGDFVVVTNAEKVRFTGKKLEKKIYYRHSGFRGNLRATTAQEQLKKRPELILMKAVKGMLPNTTLGRKQLTKLKIYQGDTHPHKAQAPGPFPSSPPKELS